MLKNYLAISVLVLLPGITNAQGFLNDQRYRGWLWFENKPVTQKPSKQSQALNQTASSPDITPEIAKAEIEQFSKELDELKFMMLARPTVENVKAYRDKEKLLWAHAEVLESAWEMANLLYPEQRDLINNPVNVHAVKAKRQLDSEDRSKKIKELAQNFDLVLFFSNSCRYCQLFSPVLKSFAEQYGFKVEAVSRDSSKHEHFETAIVPTLVERLGITVFPTVIAVSHDSKTAFELIRGYVSISELEEYSLLSVKYLQVKESAGREERDEHSRGQSE